ncbi:hypothetical protein PMAYCL1PPCAC_12384 [Pristionchus mayeri]|uniref:Beta-1,4-N-acetylgalactosaminyltransferase n=1 Tax=Pristionchus mayeri TaxID=1317129 RepID=A0AAN4ZLR3_9BILA|nr:hypothetical protein PMAYCL1PPCAC_12384 [Pristionchus mayeri]
MLRPRRCFRTCLVLPGLSLFVVLYLTYELYDWNREIEWTGWEKSTTSFKHRLCVLVPFRDREAELAEFVPHLKRFIRAQNVDNEFIILNQTDSFRFNRASLINVRIQIVCCSLMYYYQVGWFEADRIGCDYLVMHDVDLLPLNPDLEYTFPGEGVVRHIAAPKYHPKYNYEKFVGGILMLTTHDYKKIHGMSNKYWGWGLEDDEFFLRIRDGKLKLIRPEGLATDRNTTFRHIHGPNRRRDQTRRSERTEREIAEKRRRDTMGGLSNTRYKIVERSRTSVESEPVTILNVNLQCDSVKYPYCLPTHRI